MSGILGLPIMAPNDIERKRDFPIMAPNDIERKSDFPIREAEDKKITK